MMNKYFLILCLALCSPFTQAGGLTVLTYHDIVPDSSHDDYAVSRSGFVAQMDYLQLNGYTPVSLSFLDKVRKGEESLPARPVLLTFDDGLASYHDFVIPLLKIYGFPSVASIVTGWLDGENIPAEYQGKLMNWKQLAAVADSDLVEVISHTHNLHTGVRSSPQGNMEAASITRRFISATSNYESEAQYQQRITRDLMRSRERIEEKLGFQPEAIAWPYGYYNKTISDIAGNLGFRYQLTLEHGPARIDSLPMLNRIILFSDTSMADFRNELEYKNSRQADQHFVELQLDAFIGKNYLQQDALLDRLLDSLKAGAVNSVIISPFNHDVTRAFFVNDEYELAVDILNRTLHLIKAKLPVRHIYLKLPGDAELDDPDAFYLQLARLNWFNGIVFSEHPGADTLSLVRSVLDRYQPGMRYGVITAARNATVSRDRRLMDFIIYSAGERELEALLSPASNILTMNNQRTFVMLRLEDTEDLAHMDDMFARIKASGVRHFGYTPFIYDLDHSINALSSREADITDDDAGG